MKLRPLPIRTEDALDRTIIRMFGSEMLLLLLLLCSLTVLSHGQIPQHASVDDFEDQRQEPAEILDLMEALQALTMNREVSTERRAIIPMCAIGHKCAMKYGPRIGKLCDCGRAAHCNSYLLKCI